MEAMSAMGSHLSKLQKGGEKKKTKTKEPTLAPESI